MDFIKGYEIDRKEIIVTHFIWRIEYKTRLIYTKENIDKIEKMMKNQVLNAEKMQLKWHIILN